MVSCADCSAILDLIGELSHWPLHAPAIDLVRADIVAITARLHHIRARSVETYVVEQHPDDESGDTLVHSDESPPEEE